MREEGYRGVFRGYFMGMAVYVLVRFSSEEEGLLILFWWGVGRIARRFGLGMVRRIVSAAYASRLTYCESQRS